MPWHTAGVGETGGSRGLPVAEMASWPARRWAVTVLVAVAAGLAMGIPTGIVPTPLYYRMTPVTWWDYPIWVASALLIGLVAATYVRVGPRTPSAAGGGRTLGGGLMSLFAVGCPICNQLVVALLGAGGTLSYFAPVQPVLGLAALAVLGTTLALRLRAAPACRLSPS